MSTRTTIHPRIAGCRQAVPALIAAALALGGCSATHVGDAWQCPLAQGAACASVAEADPAVTPPGKTLPAKRGLHHGEKNGEAEEPAPGCVRNCDPLAWIGQWLGNAGERDDGGGPVEAEPVSVKDDPVDVAQENLRTREKIARIWIAPFVDAGGVYREGHWVRTVLEPARWRLR